MKKQIKYVGRIAKDECKKKSFAIFVVASLIEAGLQATGKASMLSFLGQNITYFGVIGICSFTVYMKKPLTEVVNSFRSGKTKVEADPNHE
ncbi:hypothetical protein [Leptospira adleri]|uniref:Uncharacterized protein n=1 Tax=Leptospira adleri TaxID=2023186 RepID=A0A2M9YJ68_9LEPT|nr:hypothetical protein [Leptospira adleri]PJZ51583.1 hypothetical protein CH380_19245 [Leptospira adleri]PJZ61908.1 hypothetical protein CH376_10920 [Leptospira adleri]